MKGKRAFTLVEAIVISALTVVIMLAIQNFFSHTVKSSLKGQDNIDSISAVCKILSELRKDLLEFEGIQTDSDTVKISTDKDSIEPDATFATIICVMKRDHGITYGLTEYGDSSIIERSSVSGREIIQKSFGGTRLRSFDLLCVINENNRFKGIDTYGQIAVNLVVQSDNKNFPGLKISVETAFFPEQLQESDWNPLPKIVAR